MGKKIIAIITGLLILFLLSIPGGADLNKISSGDSIYLGEDGLDITEAIQDSTEIGFDFDKDWTKPLYTYSITNPKSFYVSPDFFIGKTGEWYIWDGEKKGDLLFIVKEPSINLKIISGQSGQEITGNEVKPGTYVNFLISTNLMNVSKRTGFSPKDGYVSISMKQGKDGEIISSLPVKEKSVLSLSHLPLDTEEWYWIGSGDDHSLPAIGDGWDTNNSSIPPEEYWIWVSIDLNGMNKNYLAPDGSQYTGKTQTSVKRIKIAQNLPYPERTSKQPFIDGEGISGGTTN
ncbi:DUF3821 domain-containing protein [uncultured Methanospirillum sp.]|uniref:DUF3821 domain-containing protein n=1 Tax=uncultured Methanospirillum sp. TaxID=262503 RepID=UPI0029C8225F|nr:DUF3821 domain-containing protein [uncultured Methanospirillum sp.]